MQFSEKILKAINEGVYNALSFDDELPSESEIVMRKISNDKESEILSNKQNLTYYDKKLKELYDEEENEAILLHADQFLVSDKFIKLALEAYTTCGYKFKPVLYDTEDPFKTFIETIIGKFGYDRLDLSLNWIDTSEISNMDNTFRGIGVRGQGKYNLYNGDISEWDLSNVESMENMFYYSKFNNDSICNWDVSNVKNMGSLFDNNTEFNLDLSKWNINKDAETYGMFYNAASMQDEYRPKHTPPVSVPNHY